MRAPQQVLNTTELLQFTAPGRIRSTQPPACRIGSWPWSPRPDPAPGLVPRLATRARGRDDQRRLVAPARAGAAGAGRPTGSETPTSRSTATAASTWCATASRTATGFATERLSGRTELTIEATQDLSSFNLDFLLPVRGVTVDGVRREPRQAPQARARDHARRRRSRTVPPSPSRCRTPVAPARSATSGSELAGQPPRGRGDEPAPHGDVVVPVERPPQRQGADGHLHHGSARQAGLRQRRPGLDRAVAAGSRPITGSPTSRCRPTSPCSPPATSRSTPVCATACRGARSSPSR